MKYIGTLFVEHTIYLCQIKHFVDISQTFIMDDFMKCLTNTHEIFSFLTNNATET